MPKQTPTKPPDSRTLLAPLAAVLVLGLAACCCKEKIPDPVVPVAGPPLEGFVDLHTHPMANLAYSGKLLYGGPDYTPDGGSLLPSDPNCNNNVRAKDLEQALGHDRSTHGSWHIKDNPCGDLLRPMVIKEFQKENGANDLPEDAVGNPEFTDWPKSNDVTHQVMWVDSIRRAWKEGLRVMVALAVNNNTLADLVGGRTDGPADDQSSADLQFEELKALVDRNSDFMKVAYTAAQLHDIVAEGKLAVVLGVEIDNIGNFNRSDELTHQQIREEIGRLWDQGVRYVFPIHLIDNPFGGTATYLDIFNLSNLREAGHYWDLKCAEPGSGITYRPKMRNPILHPGDPGAPAMAFLMVYKLHFLSLKDPPVPACAEGVGVVNKRGLTDDGKFAIREMMRQGMLLDLDHMSQAAIDDTLKIAVAEGYPINSGHNGLRPTTGGSERSLTKEQYAQIASLHGLAGVGSAGVHHMAWIKEANDVLEAMGGTGALTFGTDANGASPLMPKPPATAPQVVYSPAYEKSALGKQSWDYNTDGVAHYGMLSDFVRGMDLVEPEGKALVAKLKGGAQAFLDSWVRAEAYSKAHSDCETAAARKVVALRSAPACPAGTSLRRACGRCLEPRQNCPVCEDGASNCLKPPRGPKGEPHSPWGSWAESSDLRTTTRAVDAPLFSNFKRARAGEAGALPSGKYVLTLSSEGLTPEPFNLDLEENPTGWTLNKGPTTATGGFAKEYWAMEWTSGNGKLMLLARPEAGKPLKGAFAMHRPGKPSVFGEFSLEPSAAGRAGAPGLEKLREFLDKLH